MTDREKEIIAKALGWYMATRTPPPEEIELNEILDLLDRFSSPRFCYEAPKP